MYLIRTKRGLTFQAKRPGDVVLRLRNKQIERNDQIRDPDLGIITVGEFVDQLEAAADTCATLELMVDDLRELLESYESWPAEN